MGAEDPRLRLPVCAYLCAVAMGLVLVPSAGAGPATSCLWRLSPKLTSGTLYGVDARATDDVWAVGGDMFNSYEGFSEPGLTRSEHWDGRSWHVVPTAKIGKGTLFGVTTLSRREAWAVGARGDRALIERWDGTRWSAVPTPDVGKSVLFGVDAASSRDVWAVGTRTSWAKIADFDGPGRPLIEHWDGTRWRIVASAGQAAELSLDDVSVAQDGAIWAVGEDPLGTDVCVERFDGGRWQVVYRIPDQFGCSVNAVDALSSRDVWIDYVDGSEAFRPDELGSQPLRWDGRRWHAAGRLPAIWACDYCNIADLAALSDRDVWAVGGCCDVLHNLYSVYVAHWDGAHWKHVHAPLDDQSRYPPEKQLYGVSAASPRDVWAVGDSGLVEHYSCST